MAFGRWAAVEAKSAGLSMEACGGVPASGHRHLPDEGTAAMGRPAAHRSSRRLGSDLLSGVLLRCGMGTGWSLLAGVRLALWFHQDEPIQLT